MEEGLSCLGGTIRILITILLPSGLRATQCNPRLQIHLFSELRHVPRYFWYAQSREITIIYKSIFAAQNNARDTTEILDTIYACTGVYL